MSRKSCSTSRAVENLHRDFLRAGSDVIEAFTYYAHREKLRLIGREGDLEPMNRQASPSPRRWRPKSDALVAGNICNTNVYKTATPRRRARSAPCTRSRSPGRWRPRRFHHRRDHLLARRGRDRARRDPADEAALGRHLRLHKKGEMRDGFSPAEAAKRIEALGATSSG
jgi:betaine-homocysteine S-methyltransferase